MKRTGWNLCFIGILVGLARTTPAPADFYRDAATGLAAFGFDPRAGNNPFSGGQDYLLTSTFDGSVFDFGVVDMALQGPLSVSFSNGGRLIPEWEFSVRTAQSPDSGIDMLNYAFNLDPGPVATRATGSVLLDANFSLNKLGFYDLEFTYSARQNVQREGESSTSGSFDADVGPIDVSGNLFVDLLSLVVDPLYAGAGLENPLARFSGVGQLKQMIETQSRNSLEQLVAERLLPDSRIALTDSPRAEFGAAFAENLETSIPPHAIGSPGASPLVTVVPEPAVLTLLLLAAAFYFRRSRPVDHVCTRGVQDAASS